MSCIEQEVKELRERIRIKDALILSLSEKLLIVSQILSRLAERKERRNQ